MATTKLGLPQILIDFRTQAATAITRSTRGVGVMVLHDDEVDTEAESSVYFRVTEADDIPAEGISARSVDLIKKSLLGTPLSVHVFLIPGQAEKEVEREVESEVEVIETTQVVTTDSDTGEAVSETVESLAMVESTVTITETVVATVTLASVLREAADIKFNYICVPTGSSQEQEDLATWVKTQREQKNKTFKAVVSGVAADNYSVINFTTGKIRVVNPEYTDALDAAGGDEELVDETIPHYNTYTAKEYTARIMGILAGISLDRSATYYQLTEVYDCEKYDDIDENINNGELCLFDERDGNGVKIARGCNSLTTFTNTKGSDFRFIKIVEAVDLITDDIKQTFRDDYVGKVNNTYNNKMLLIAAINTYLTELGGSVLDNAESANNYVEIDYDAQKKYIKAKGIEVSDKERQYILEYPTGTFVFLRGVVRPVNAMEDLELHFTIE